MTGHELRGDGWTVKQKKERLAASILFATAAVIWAVTIIREVHYGGAAGPGLVLRCGCVLAFGAAAVAQFVRYLRGDDQE